MSNNTTTKQGGIGFLGILALIFITLKLIGILKWSWLWVLAPIWIPFAIVAVILVIGLILSFIGHVLRQRQNKKVIQNRKIS